MKSARAGGTSKSSGRSWGRSRLSLERTGDPSRGGNTWRKDRTPSCLFSSKTGSGRDLPRSGWRQDSNSNTSKVALLTLREGLLGVGLDEDFRKKWRVGIVNLLSELELRPDDIFCMKQPESFGFGFFAIFACLGSMYTNTL